MTTNAIIGCARVQRGFAVASRAQPALCCRNLPMVDDDDRHPAHRGRIMACIAIVRGYDVAERLGVARHTGADHFGVIDTYGWPPLNGGVTRLTAVGGIGVADHRFGMTSDTGAAHLVMIDPRLRTQPCAAA